MASTHGKKASPYHHFLKWEGKKNMHLHVRHSCVQAEKTSRRSIASLPKQHTRANGAVLQTKYAAVCHRVRALLPGTEMVEAATTKVQLYSP